MVSQANKKQTNIRNVLKYCPIDDLVLCTMTFQKKPLQLCGSFVVLFSGEDFGQIVDSICKRRVLNEGLFQQLFCLEYIQHKVTHLYDDFARNPRSHRRFLLRFSPFERCEGGYYSSKLLWDFIISSFTSFRRRKSQQERKNHMRRHFLLSHFFYCLTFFLQNHRKKLKYKINNMMIGEKGEKQANYTWNYT